MTKPLSEEERQERVQAKRTVLVQAVRDVSADMTELGLWPSNGTPYVGDGRYVRAWDLLIAAKTLINAGGRGLPRDTNGGD